MGETADRDSGGRAEAGRTEGPLDYFVGNANGRGLIRIEAGIDSPVAGKHIASMPRGAQSEADAAFIVRAWNNHDDLVQAIERADKLIWAMAVHIGRMALYDEAIADLNEHGLFVEKSRRTGVLPRAALSVNGGGR